MIGNDWDNVLKNIYDGEYFRPLLLKVQNEYKNKVIFPPKHEVFNAFRLTPFASNFCNNSCNNSCSPVA